MSALFVALIICLQVGYFAVAQDIVRNNKEPKHIDTSVRAVRDSLPTDGFCWTLTTEGKICFEENAFQSVSMMGDELFYEEFVDGKKYSYKMQNTKKLQEGLSRVPEMIGNRKVAHAMSDTSWLEENDRVKYGCKVENLEGFHFDSRDNHILKTNGDGSSVWTFGDWVIDVDPKMIPISLRGDHGDQFIAYIQGLEKFLPEKNPSEKYSSKEYPTKKNPSKEYPTKKIPSKEYPTKKIPSKIIGCDIDEEANESPKISSRVHERYLKILDAHDPSISEDEYFSEKGSTRRLDWVTDLQGSISNTQWCGAGTDNSKTPCPNPSLSFDFYADQACRRHDHGAKFEKTWIGLPRLECYVDKQLNDAGGHNWAVSAAYGKAGGMGLIGCYNYEDYNCWSWKGWSLKYGYCGKKWDINYGYWRYDGAKKTDGYKPRPQQCPYDSYLTW